MAVVSIIPQATGVPGLSGPPQWWSSGAGFNTGLDDPRWRGAYQVGFGSGTSDQVTFRALADAAGGSPQLYLSWFVKVDPALSASNDYLIFGLEGAGQPTLVLQIQMNGTSAVTAADLASGAYTRTVLRRNGASFDNLTDMGSTPTWADDKTRVWRIPGGNSMWAIQMVVPAASMPGGAGLGALGTALRMWFYINNFAPAMGTAQYRWPGSLTPATFNFLSYPAAGAGERCSLINVPAGDTAKTAISIDYLHIGTRNADPHTIKLTSANTLFAEPKNDTGSTIPANTLSARFRLANWGSHPPLPAEWSEVGSPSPANTHAAIANGTHQALETQFTVSPAERSEYQAHPHQCMLVELSGPGMTFTTSSVVRNMDFVPGSTFSRPAEISVKGLAPISIKPRDVYLYVELVNMPVKETQGDRGRREEFINREGDPKENFANLQKLYQSSGRWQAIEPLMPTYRVHAFHDTGARTTVDGTVYPVLEAQGSFGFHVFHQGELEGWTHNLVGAEKLAENIYVIRVPNGGTAQVETVIQAVEPGEERLPAEKIFGRPKYDLTEPAAQGCLTLLQALLASILKLFKSGKS